MLVYKEGCIMVTGKPEYFVSDDIYLKLSRDKVIREYLLSQLGRMSVVIGRMGEDKGGYNVSLFDVNNSVDLASVDLFGGGGYELAV